jgi:hypothetical protein
MPNLVCGPLISGCYILTKKLKNKKKNQQISLFGFSHAAKNVKEA